uniref:MARVEL domain-containing protein n=1 Tax=Setaria digitata TaxID=48799 RepID=A0A915PY00_9BILA
MLKAEDLEQQNPHEQNLAATVEATTVENVPTNVPSKDRGGPQLPPSYATPAPSSPKRHQQQKRRLKFDMSRKIQIIPDNRQGQFNTTFLATIPGVMKIGEIVGILLVNRNGLSLEVAANFLDGLRGFITPTNRNATAAAWTENISFVVTVIISALLIGYVCFPHLTIKNELTREGLIVTELIFYGISTLLFFIAIWLMVHLSASWIAYGRGSAVIDAIICVALTILFGIETFAKLKAWRGENEPTIVQPVKPLTESGRYYEPNEVLQRSQGPELA